MKLLVVAAGLGTRLRRGAKHLVELWGRPLIYYPITASRRYVDGEVLVVVQSFFAEETRARLRENGIEAIVVASFCPYCENGYSLLLGLSRAKSEVLLTVADHVYEPCLVERLLQNCPVDAGVCVAGDREPRLVDVDEATKIVFEGSRVVFTKSATSYDYIDTGVFVVRDYEGILERFALRTELTMNRLWSEYSAAGGRVEVVDVTGCRWGDVDTEADLAGFMSGARRSLMESILLALGG